MDSIFPLSGGTKGVSITDRQTPGLATETQPEPPSNIPAFPIPAVNPILQGKEQKPREAGVKQTLTSTGILIAEVSSSLSYAAASPEFRRMCRQLETNT